MKKYILIFILCYPFFYCSVNKDIQESNYNLQLKRNLVDNIGILYLQNGNIRVDSLKLNGAVFYIDSLRKIDSSMWHYMYSIRCGSGCTTSMQIILTVKNHKMHISYSGYFESSDNIDDLYYAEDTSLKPSDVMEYTHSNEKFYLNDSFLKKPIVTEYLYKGKVTDTGNGDKAFYSLKYDTKEKVYYNTRKKMIGEYLLFEGSTEKNIQLNETVYSLKFKENEWVYFKDTWYEFNSKNNSLQKFPK